MRAKTFKLIINKTAKTLGRETIKNNNTIKDMLRAIAQDPEFRDYSLIFSTGATVGGLLVSILIKNGAATSEQVEALSEKVDGTQQKLDELLALKEGRSLDSQEQEQVEKLSSKIVESFKKQGLIPQEGEIKSDLIESENNNNESDQETKKLKKELANKDTIIRNQRISLIGITAMIFVAILFRPSKALDIIETLVNEN